MHISYKSPQPALNHTNKWPDEIQSPESELFQNHRLQATL